MNNIQYLIGSLLIFAIPSSGFAANVITNWDGGSSGSYTWESGANWDNGFPNNGSDNYQAVIGNSTGNRVITTSSDITVSRIQISQSASTAGAGTTLQLGGNLTVNGTSAIPGFTNTAFINSTGDASKLVIDLAGYNLSVLSPTAATGYTDLSSMSNLTIRSSGDAGGVFALRQISTTSGNQNVHVQNNVSIKLTQASLTQYFRGYTFSDDSTVWFAGTGNFSSVRAADTLFSNVLVGDASASARTTIQLMHSGVAAVRIKAGGSFILDTYTGATGGDASLLLLNGHNFYVGGSFTDKGTNSDTYGSGTIYFNGNPVTEQAVSIGRQSLTNHFQVGENAGSAGNIALTNNLTTTGTFSVLGNSSLNLNTQTLQAGTVTLENDFDLVLTFGEISGHIAAGNLTVGNFNLALTYDGSGWIDGSDLLLFSYTGDSTTVNPLLSSLSLSGFTHDGLIHDDVLKIVYLSNMAIIPEPGCMVLLLLGGSLMLGATRRRIS